METQTHETTPTRFAIRPFRLSPSFSVNPLSGTRYSMQMGISTISDFSAYQNTYQPKDFQFM